MISSTIKRDRARIECISRVQIGKRILIGYYSSTLMFAEEFGEKVWIRYTEDFDVSKRKLALAVSDTHKR